MVLPGRKRFFLVTRVGIQCHRIKLFFQAAEKSFLSGHQKNFEKIDCPCFLRFFREKWSYPGQNTLYSSEKKYRMRCYFTLLSVKRQFDALVENLNKQQVLIYIKPRGQKKIFLIHHHLKILTYFFPTHTSL